MSKTTASLFADSLHPAVTQALREHDFLDSLTEHFPDIYRIVDEYARIASLSCTNEEICERLITFSKATEMGQSLNGCVPSDTAMFTEFVVAVTKDADALIIDSELGKDAQKRANELLPKSARRVLVRQTVSRHA